MREIKFRAWDKGLKIMLVNYANPKYGVEEFINTEAWRPSDNFELMQYTGLKDKNGVEIYEGDILKQHLNGHIFEVEMSSKDTDYMCWSVPLDAENIEVIGNIHENPELL